MENYVLISEDGSLEICIFTGENGKGSNIVERTQKNGKIEYTIIKVFTISPEETRNLYLSENENLKLVTHTED